MILPHRQYTDDPLDKLQKERKSLKSNNNNYIFGLHCVDVTLNLVLLFYYQINACTHDTTGEDPQQP